MNSYVIGLCGGANEEEVANYLEVGQRQEVEQEPEGVSEEEKVEDSGQGNSRESGASSAAEGAATNQLETEEAAREKEEAQAGEEEEEGGEPRRSQLKRSSSLPTGDEERSEEKEAETEEVPRPASEAGENRRLMAYLDEEFRVLRAGSQYLKLERGEDGDSTFYTVGAKTFTRWACLHARFPDEYPHKAPDFNFTGGTTFELEVQRNILGRLKRVAARRAAGGQGCVEVCFKELEQSVR